jgi:hypothetical protein
MNIRGVNISLNLPGRQNLWALFLLLFSILSLVQGVTTTHWMASLRKGDSIIPHKNELTRIGPFSISEIRTRNSVLVGFASPGKPIKYKEEAAGLSIAPNAVKNLIRKYSGQPVAFLLTSKINPMREIWGIDIAGLEVLSYEKAVFYYKVDDSSAYSYFLSSITCAIWLFVSIIELRRI